MIRAELERRPLLILCLGLILGITLVRHPVHLLFLLPAPWVLQALRARALLVGSLAVGVLSGPGAPPGLIAKNEFVNTNFEVVSVPQSLSFGQSCVIEHGDLRMVLTYIGPVQLYPGQLLSIHGVAKPPNEAQQAFFESQNLVAAIEARGDSVSVVRDGPWIQQIAFGWRSQFVQLTSANLSPELASTDNSILLSL